MGLAYVHSRFINAGAIPLAIVLEQNGFERYTIEGESQLLEYMPNKYGGGKEKKYVIYAGRRLVMKFILLAIKIIISGM